jgi:hypothetical protein
MIIIKAGKGSVVLDNFAKMEEMDGYLSFENGEHIVHANCKDSKAAAEYIYQTLSNFGEKQNLVIDITEK